MPRCKRFTVLPILALAAGLVVSWASGTFAAGLTFTCADPVRITQVDWIVEVEAVLTNTAAVGDRYDIIRTIVHRPPDWTTPVCIGTCMADFVDSTTVLLPAGQDTTVGVQFNTDVDEGGAVIQILARSWVDPSKKVTLTMAVITDGTEVLIVDDDGGQDYQDYLSAAYEGTRTWGVWPRNLEPLTAADLLQFDLGAWMTGEFAPALTPEDTLAIGGFLDGGGRLFLTGQNVGYDLCDAGSAYYTAGMKAFYEDRFGAQDVQDDSGILTVEGVPGDPITDGLTLAISGGDGADNQTAPSEVSPLGAGSAAIFNYASTAQAAAVRVAKGAGKVVYLAFGFEAISGASDRAGLAGAIWDWLSMVGAVEEDAPAAPIASALRCYPNPFNPSVTISFSVSHPAPVSVEIYDVRGRQVVTLPAEARSAGPLSVEWDGRDALGRPVASGMYACRVSVDDRETLMQKLVLLK